jgi:hypothetical protein
MKALEKERARRYQTAHGLAMDIQRYLANEPVLARPPSRIYQLQKLVKRNKMAFLAAAAVCATLIAGLGTSTWLLLKEREAHQRAVDAERKQAQLTQEAEQARLSEAKLRHQAEAREKVTQATILVSQDKLDEADEMIAAFPPTEPSVEAATLLRALGDWHALHGRWVQAAQRYGLVPQVDLMEGWDQRALSAFVYGVCLVESGQTRNYEEFRQNILARFASTTSGPAVERILKISLLEPGAPSVKESLAPFARAAEAAFSHVDVRDAEAVLRGAWGSISLAFWEYRQGHYIKSIEWTRSCLDCAELNAPREAAAHLELAMALYQSGQKSEAAREFNLGREAIEKNFAQGLKQGNGDQGFWFDWVFARILMREAGSLIQPSANGSR